MLDEGNSQLSAVGFFNPVLGGGDAVGVSGGACVSPGVFDISDGKIVRCALVFGRQWVWCEDTQLDILGEGETPSGMIYAEVDHSTSSLGLAVKHTTVLRLPDNSLQKSYRALYYADGSSWADARFPPVLFAMN